MAGARNEERPEPADAEPTPADFRHLADTIPQLAWIADGDGRDLLVQPALVRLHRHDPRGDARPGLVARSIIPTTSPASSERYQRGLRAAARPGRTPSRCAATTALSAGSCRAPMPLRDADGRDPALVRHQHRRHRAARRRGARCGAPRSASARWSMPRPTLIWTASPAGELIPPHAGWRAYTGPDRGGSTQGWGWLDAVHPDDREPRRRRLARGLRGRAPAYQVEYRLRRRDGEWRVMEARGVPVLDARRDACANGSASTPTSPSGSDAEEALERGARGRPRPPTAPRASSSPT